VATDATRGEAFGRYRLLERLGEGGMGVVYRASVEDERGVVRHCVIKRIRTPLAEDPVFVEALVREARLCARLHHPGIVQLLELGAVGNERYLAMQWLDGVDLRRILKQCRALGVQFPPGLACFIASEVASALAYAHALCDDEGRPMGIIHRDVTPSNILATRPGRLMLLDFGIARATSHLGEDARTGTGLIKGTLGYMSPEQAAGEPLDGRTDLFSLGAVLFESLTGQPLFRAGSPIDMLRQIANLDAPPTSSLRPEIEADIDEVVLKLLARNRVMRYATAGELVAALRPIVSRHQADADGLSAFFAETLRGSALDAPGAAAAVADARPTEDEARTSTDNAGSSDAMLTSDGRARRSFAEPPSPGSSLRPPTEIAAWPPRTHRRWLAVGLALAMLAVAAAVFLRRSPERAVVQQSSSSAAWSSSASATSPANPKTHGSPPASKRCWAPSCARAGSCARSAPARSRAWRRSWG
jgi:serine/threonine protein kinase